MTLQRVTMRSAALVCVVITCLLISAPLGHAAESKIVGQLVDDTGRPVSQYPIRIVPIGDHQRSYAAVTDFAGEFVIFGLPAGTYQIVPINQSQDLAKTIYIQKSKNWLWWGSDPRQSSIDLIFKLPSTVPIELSDEVAKVINTEAAKTLNPEAARTLNPAAAKTLNPEAAKTLSPEAAKTLNPEAARVLHPDRAKYLTAEEARTITAAEAMKPLPWNNLKK